MALEEKSEEENASAVAELKVAISQNDVADVTILKPEKKSKEDHAAAVGNFETAVSKNDEDQIREIVKSNGAILHYAAKKNSLRIVKELLKHGANVNATNAASVTPLHVAAQYASKEVVSVLLQNGAIYDAVDDLETKAIDIAKNNEISKLLRSTESLFASVRKNNLADVERNIKSGAILEAKNSEGITVLHYAAWEDLDRIVETLLGFNANVNVRSFEGLTPLHYAVKESHVAIVNSLLFHGALFDAEDDNGKTPSDLSNMKVLSELFKLIRACFQKIQADDETVINDINKIDCLDTKKAVMGARNNEGYNLAAVAISQKFSKLHEFKTKLFRENGDAGFDLLRKRKYEKALNVFKSAWKERLRLLGPDNLFTLEAEVLIGGALEKLGRDHESLDIYQRLCKKQTEILGSNAVDTLNTRMKIALMTSGLGNKGEAFEDMEQISTMRDEICGPDDEELMQRAFDLEVMRRHDKAFEIYESISTDYKRKLNGGECSKSLLVENFMGLIQFRQGKYKESIQTLLGVLTTRAVTLGCDHPDTIRTLVEMEFIHAKMGARSNDADAVYKEILKHKLRVAQKFMEQGMPLNALKLLREILMPLRAVFGGKSSRARECVQGIMAANKAVRFFKIDETEVLQDNNKVFMTAIINGNADGLFDILGCDGSPDVNVRDEEGRTPLHLAVSRGNLEIVEILVERGADVTLANAEGYTPLHTAVANGSIYIVRYCYAVQ